VGIDIHAAHRVLGKVCGWAGGLVYVAAMPVCVVWTVLVVGHPQTPHQTP
jgi:hypothetical protein